MRKSFLLVSMGILFTVSGCSGSSQKDVSRSAPTVVQAAVVPVSASPQAEPAAVLPLPSAGQANQHAWHSENVADQFGNTAVMKGTSSDSKFDFIIVKKGKYSFLSFARHGRWESVSKQPAKGKLLVLRAKFEDGQEKRIEWDDLGFATENLYGVLWSYPVKADAPIGPVPEGAKGDSVGGDQLLLEDLMKHKTMLLEVEPGITTQFDLTGLAREIQKVRAPQTPSILAAGQTAE